LNCKTVQFKNELGRLQNVNFRFTLQNKTGKGTLNPSDYNLSQHAKRNITGKGQTERLNAKPRNPIQMPV